MLQAAMCQSALDTDNRPAENRSVPTAAVVAEWLRRWTRNPMGSPRTGSNPVGSEYFFQNILRLFPVANVTKV